MNVLNYLQTNIKWHVHKNQFADLHCLPTTEDQLFSQLERLAGNYYPQRKPIDTLMTEFCLNQVALTKAKTPQMKAALCYFDGFWQEFLRIKRIFGKKHMLFPCNTSTRVEDIATLIARCTQFAASEQQLSRATARAEELFDLTEREKEYLPDVIALCRIKLYCCLMEETAGGSRKAETNLAKMLRPEPLKSPYCANKTYSRAPYSSANLLAQVDCLGNSAVRFNDVVSPAMPKLYVYRNGRNVFDTFCNSRFGVYTADFHSQTPSCKTEMQYFAEKGREVRKYKITNLCKKKMTYCCQVVSDAKEAKSEFFACSGVRCIAFENFYAAFCIVEDGKISSPTNEADCLCLNLSVSAGGTKCFDLVCLYATDVPSLANMLDELNVFGATACPFLCDRPADYSENTDRQLTLTPYGHTGRKYEQKQSDRICFSYQIGNADLSTFVDNGGRCATLIKGFAFGVGGEKIYSVSGGMLNSLFDGKYSFCGDVLTYSSPKATLSVAHGENKTYKINYSAPAKTLFYFPFEHAAKITKNGNDFCVSDGERTYKISFWGKIDGFTTDILECNEKRLRYKLSGNTSGTNCLAVCTSAATQTVAVISVCPSVPKPTPLITDSLISTYLNYVNNKSVFCLTNKLKRLNALTLAAICYTNPQFVRQYLQKLFDGYVPQYYDAQGKFHTATDSLALPLATAYYANLAADKSFPKPEHVKFALDTLLTAEYTGKAVCVQALALKKILPIAANDKVAVLIKLDKLKKQIASDVSLFASAQAIGALPLLHPSKARLKDLCNANDVPKNWYYVSQLENIYGLSVCKNRLNVIPTTAENALDGFVLTIGGKKIETSFAKASAQSMTLNGVTCFQSFSTDSLKNAQNTLIVRY